MYFIFFKLENIRLAVCRQTEGEAICLQVSVNLNNKTYIEYAFFCSTLQEFFSPHSFDCGMRYCNLGSSLCEKPE